METYRYEELAASSPRLVDGGTLTPGTRAPSLREISRDQNVSMATALQAYRLLEDRGILQARPQSGFYVARRPLLREARLVVPISETFTNAIAELADASIVEHQ